MKEMKDMKNVKDSIDSRRAPWVFAFLMSFMLVPHGPHVSALAAPQQVPAIVSTSWLAERLKDPGVAVISSDDLDDFGAGHIAGARVVPHDRTFGADHRALSGEALARVLADAGASDTTHVVLYGASPMRTGWLYMTFASIGRADRVSLLDGNLSLWRTEGRPVARGPATPAAARGRLTPRPAPDVAVNADWVLGRLETPGVRVLDVRTTREWDQGRLPGARFVLWQDLYASTDTGRFKTPEQIRTLLARAGVEPGDQVVTYCAVGMRASLMYFAATRLAGLNGRVYVGSMEDWRRQGYKIVR